MSWQNAILRAPLVPVAVLATAGIVLDRTLSIGWPVWCAIAVAGLGSWLLALRDTRFAILGLALALAGIAALHHNVHRNIFPADDIGSIISDEPKLVRLRGRLRDEPTFNPPAAGDPLRSIPDAARTYAVLDVEALLDGADERSISGRVAVTMVGAKPGMRAGDGVEVTGWINKPRGPDNPGERDYASALLDDRIRATMLVRRVGDGMVKPLPSSDWSWDHLAATARTWSRRQLEETLPPAEAAVGAALLLGDGTALARDDWQKYIRTGVVHVLAVSGQHMVVLAGFAWFVLRGLGIRQRHSAVVVALGLCFYAAVAGGRPPVFRAAVMVSVASGAILLRRKSHPGNSLALAWLIIVLLNPAEVFDLGGQLSFACVAVLLLGIARWLEEKPVDPLLKLIEAGRPTWQRVILSVWNSIKIAYIVSFTLGVVCLPLVALRYHMIQPIGILIGPPAIALASIALISGFMQLIAAFVYPPLAAVIAAVTKWSLAGLGALVDLADQVPYGHWYVDEIPQWWVAGFYALLAFFIWRWRQRSLASLKNEEYWAALIRWRWRQNLRIGIASLLAWSSVGIASSFIRAKPDGLRVTFMAVGHGGATLIETPDGRKILVDVGAMSGPDVTRRIVAPYLWHLGISHLDEVFLTHADLDHFNGLPQLMERFHIGRVNLTPTFAAKPTPGVREVVQRLERDRIPTRTVRAGDRFTAGDVELEVFHPPAANLPGPENARSLVLIIRHAGHSIALTGDLDLEGRMQFMTQRIGDIDVWMAPHHGGRTASPPELAAWVRPRLVVAHNATGEAKDAASVYQSLGATFVGTWPHGAITITSKSNELRVETYRTKKTISLRRTDR